VGFAIPFKIGSGSWDVLMGRRTKKKGTEEQSSFQYQKLSGHCVYNLSLKQILQEANLVGLQIQLGTAPSYLEYADDKVCVKRGESARLRKSIQLHGR